MTRDLKKILVAMLIGMIAAFMCGQLQNISLEARINEIEKAIFRLAQGPAVNSEGRASSPETDKPDTNR